MTTVFTGHKATHWVDKDEFVPGLPLIPRWHGLKSKHPYDGEMAPFCSRSIQSSTCMCKISLTGRERAGTIIRIANTKRNYLTTDSKQLTVIY